MVTAKSAISHEEAAELATRLRRQGIEYSRIAAELNSRGYISPRTKAPIKEMAVRYMITAEAARDRQDAREEIEDKKIILTTGERTLRENIATLLAIKEFAPDMKLRLIQSLLQGEVK
jgi:hypothetical protein